MAWIDLEQGVLEEFAERSSTEIRHLAGRSTEAVLYRLWQKKLLQAKEWRSEHREHCREYLRLCRSKNPVTYRALHVNWWEERTKEQKALARASWRKYYYANREKVLKRNNDRRLGKRERTPEQKVARLADNKAYYAKHKERILAKKRERHMDQRKEQQKAA